MQEPAVAVKDCLAAIEAAQDRDEVIATLRRAGLLEAVERLEFLIELEVEEPDEPPMSLTALRQLAHFLLLEGSVTQRRIAVGPNGEIGLDWRLPGGGYVALTFIADGDVVYVADAPQAPELPRQRGTADLCRASNAIRPFLILPTTS